MYSLTKATEVFTKHYEINNKDISNEVLKYNTHKLRHSNGVLEIGRHLIIKIKENQTLTDEIINKSEIIFFLHDLGRFYQNNKNNILTNEEFEHGDEGYNILKNELYDESICLAVKYHNKYSIEGLYSDESFNKMPVDIKNETDFLGKIIRDADKLQNMIYTVFAIEGLTKLNPKLSKGDISDEIIRDLKKEKPINRDNIKTYADDLVGILCRLYDINFKESIDILNYYGYFEKIINEISKLEGVSEEKIEIIKNNILNYKIN